MPNAYVFPGGLVDSSDFSSEWLDVFASSRLSPAFGLGAVKQPLQTRPPLFAADRAELGSPIPGEVAFRICAVRETFEESGILLAIPKEGGDTVVTEGHEGNHRSNTLAQVPELCGQRQLAEWRLRVIADPCNFIQMCKELGCVPNIWALHEWGNWLTPTGTFAAGRRYDTAFFVCCLQGVPHTVQDEKEIVHFKWSTPSEIVCQFQAREIWVAPPQFYELSRISRLPKLQDLHSFASERAAEGCERWLPISLACSDGNVSLLPGDDLYPENPDWSGLGSVKVTKKKSLKELQQESSRFHRIVMHSLFDISIHANITPKYKHLLPITQPIQGSDVEPSSHL
ncbi:NUD19 protein, partial [Atractosteus spatula]|nr:NUD19 protein [Atractosteus spatula]